MLWVGVGLAGLEGRRDYCTCFVIKLFSYLHYKWDMYNIFIHHSTEQINVVLFLMPRPKHTLDTELVPKSLFIKNKKISQVEKASSYKYPRTAGRLFPEWMLSVDFA